MKLSLCIVGCGGYARTLLEEIGDVSGEVELFFASRNAEKARSYCETFRGAGFFGTYEEAASDPRVGALYFLTPHQLHLKNALLAARHSKHLLVEKPIARTISEAREMIHAARAAGVRLMVAENYRFLTTVGRCKQLMAQGVIGDLRLLQIQAEGYLKPTGWRASATFMGGGALIDGGIHYVDVLVNLGGFPEGIYATAPPRAFPDSEAEDGMVITLQLPGGAVGLINYSSGTAASRGRQWISVTGNRGQLSFEPFGSVVTLDTADGERTIELQEGGRGSRAMIREFRDCVVEGREPAMSGEEGLRDLAVVLGAYRSAELKSEVSVSPP